MRSKTWSVPPQKRSAASSTTSAHASWISPPDTIDGPPHPAKAAAEVWVLRHDDKHGDDISLYASRALGLGALAQTVRSRWDNITGNPGVPATGDSLADEAAVEMYFRHRTGIESYSLYSEDVNGVRNARPPYELSETDSETLIALAAIIAGEHRNRPDQGATAHLRVLSELNQGPADAAEIHDLALRALTRIRAARRPDYRRRYCHAVQ